MGISLPMQVLPYGYFMLHSQKLEGLTISVYEISF